MGDRASLTCSVVKGDLPLTMSWRKDNRPIDATQHMSVKQVDQYNSILVIENLGSDHTGNYSCVVRNSAAEVENSQSLLVNGKQMNLSTKWHCSLLVFCCYSFCFVVFSTYVCTTIIMKTESNNQCSLCSIRFLNLLFFFCCYTLYILYVGRYKHTCVFMNTCVCVNIHYFFNYLYIHILC